MDLKLWSYLAYLGISIGMTIWVAHTLSRNGIQFLIDVFGGNRDLANSVNHLLVVGFYLINLGFIAVALRIEDALPTPTLAMESVAMKVGAVLFVLGIMHFFNLYVFSRMRRRSQLRDAPPPITPDDLLQMGGDADGPAPLCPEPR